MRPPTPGRTPDRFDRQVRFAPLGPEGQARVQAARVLVVGCGALGGVLVQTLARCGVGTLVLVDRDVVDATNLARQVLFEQRDVEQAVPKVRAAARAVERIGGPTRTREHAVHLDASNVAELAAGCDLILDGTDNLATRYLVNDFAVRHGLPWVHAGVVASRGLCLPVLPGRGPCLRCLFPTAPPAGTLPTCDGAGVILPAVGAVGSLQAGWALRLLSAADREGIAPRLVEVDVWTGATRSLAIERAPDCPCCVQREFAFLDRPVERSAVILCGRNAVQVRGSGAAPDLGRLASSLEGVADSVRRAGDLLRFWVDALRVTVFPDGRALVEGTEDRDRARAVYDRYVGS